MKNYVVKSNAGGALFEGKTNDFATAATWFDKHNKDHSATVITDADTGEVLMQGENGAVLYIEPGVILAMLRCIGEVDPETGFMLGVLTLLSGVLE